MCRRDLTLLPQEQDLDLQIRYALARPVRPLRTIGRSVYFFMVPDTLSARSLNLGMVTPLCKNGGVATWPPTARKLANVPRRGNILGAAVIGTDRSTGVIDWYGHAFGYENLLVCDGAMPADPGVNPSLTITHDRARDSVRSQKECVAERPA